MIGIVFTTAEEARPFLDRYRQGAFDALDEGETAQDRTVVVAVTGIGKIKATFQTQQLLTTVEPDRLIHAGTSTALDPELPIGEPVGISHVLEGDRVQLSALSYPRMPLEIPFDDLDEGTLVTHDHELSEGEEHSYWQRIADLSDTTGYAMAYVAGQHGTPCHLVKVPTGVLGEENEDFRKTLEAAYDTMADLLLDYLERAAGDE